MIFVDFHLHSGAAEPKLASGQINEPLLDDFLYCRQLLDGVYGDLDVDGMWQRRLRALYHICSCSRILLDLPTNQKAAAE